MLPAGTMNAPVIGANVVHAGQLWTITHELAPASYLLERPDAGPGETVGWVISRTIALETWRWDPELGWWEAP